MELDTPTTRLPRDVAGWIAAGSAVATTVVAFLVNTTARYRPPFTDEIVYRLHAHNLLTFHFYGYSHYSNIAYRPPGYPFFDAAVRAINDSDAAVRAAQAVLAGMIVYLSAWIARRLFGRLASALTALLLVAVGTIATYASFELSETVATVTLIGSIAVLISAIDKHSLKWGFSAGALLGASILIRPQTMLLVVPIVLVLLLPSRLRNRERLALALILVGGAVAIVLPWTIRNAIRLHAFVPVSTYGGEAFFLANNPKADGLFHRTTVLAGQALYEKVQSKPEEERDRYWYRLAFHFILHNPGKAVRNWLRDGYYFLKLPDDLVQKWYFISPTRRIPPLDDRILWPFVLIGVYPVLRSKRQGSGLLLVVIPYFILFFMFFIPTPRFRHGVIPFNAIVAAAGIAYFAERGIRLLRGEKASDREEIQSGPEPAETIR